jgi:hypothetical protein
VKPNPVYLQPCDTTLYWAESINIYCWASVIE